MAKTPYNLKTIGDNAVRNLLINSDFSLWQRGVSSSSNGYLADRWRMDSAGYTHTVTRSTDIPTVTQSGYQSQYSWLVTNGTGASPSAAQLQQISYKLEGYDYQQIHAHKGRLQYWVKSSVTGTYCASLLNNAGNRSYVTTYSITSANTWQKITLDFGFDTTGTWNFDNTLGLYILFTLTAGSNFTTSNQNIWQGTGSQGAIGQTQWGATTGATFQLSQVALIPGNYESGVSIPHQRAGRTIQQELAMCQRYYWRPSYEDTTSSGVLYGVGQAFTAGAMLVYIPFVQNMRTVPALSSSGLGPINAAGSTQAGFSFALTIGTTSGAYIQGTGGAGLVAGNASGFSRRLASDFLAFDAEL